MFIIHGENQASSRQKLTELVAVAEDAGRQVWRLAAKNLTPAQLSDQATSQHLFLPDQTIVIEDLHALPTSARKKELLDLVATIAGTDTQTDLILWEKKTLTPTMLKKFATAKVFEFPISKTLFKWLDSLRGQANEGEKSTMLRLFHQTVSQDGDFMTVSMLARQIRLLIEVSETGRVGGPPFLAAKLQKQARTFSLTQLLDVHRQLLEIDLHLKTSTSPLSLVQELDLLLLKL